MIFCRCSCNCVHLLDVSVIYETDVSITCYFDIYRTKNDVYIHLKIIIVDCHNKVVRYDSWKLLAANLHAAANSAKRHMLSSAVLLTHISNIESDQITVWMC